MERGQAPPRPTVAAMSLGCRANQEEIECILSALRDQGFDPVPFGSRADWTIVNTCSVTCAGESDSRQAIRRAVRVNGQGRVVATGCFAQRDPAGAGSLGAGLVVGNAEKSRLPELIAGMQIGDGSCMQILHGPDPTIGRFLRHGSRSRGYRTRAALKIQDGCDERCTYCIIPSLRGRSVSRDPDEVLDEARSIAGLGYSDLTLTGIHSASYGHDLGQGRDGLAALLKRFLDISGLRRIRVNSLEPQWVTEDLLTTIGSDRRFARHLHLPLQSGDPGILKRMGRGYTPGGYRDLVEKARRLVPGVAIGADVLVGFPGEGDAAFGNTLALLEELQPAYLHVFPYSDRPGVASTRLPGTVGVSVKRDRARRLRDLDGRLRAAFLRASDGTIHEVLAEGREEAGRPADGLTDTYIRVAIGGEIPAGSWARIRLRWTGDPRRMLAVPCGEQGLER